MSDIIEPIDVALGELRDEQRAEAERLMRDDPEFRREVEELGTVVTALEDLPEEAWDPPPAPPLKLPTGERRSLLERLGLSPLRFGFPAIAAAGAGALALLAIGFGIGTVSSGDDDPSRGETIALASLVSESQQAVGNATPVGGDRLEVDVSGLPASQGGDRYELWEKGDRAVVLQVDWRLSGLRPGGVREAASWHDGDVLGRMWSRPKSFAATKCRAGKALWQASGGSSQLCSINSKNANAE